MKNYESDELIQIEKTEAETDLGIQVSANLKHNIQISKSASKANIMLGMLERTFATKNKDILKNYTLHTLGLTVSAWTPYLKKDIDTLEKVQRRATKISPTIKNLVYENRLVELKLTTPGKMPNPWRLNSKIQDRKQTRHNRMGKPA